MKPTNATPARPTGPAPASRRGAPFAENILWSPLPTRTLPKSDMVHNGAAPDISVDPETSQVKADGVQPACEPASELALAQPYFLF